MLPSHISKTMVESRAVSVDAWLRAFPEIKIKAQLLKNILLISSTGLIELEHK